MNDRGLHANEFGSLKVGDCIRHRAGSRLLIIRTIDRGTGKHQSHLWAYPTDGAGPDQLIWWADLGNYRLVEQENA